ncbi:hypothetical protein [Achromobacter xylosoxidans]|uniref:hypothetical protein n=1 Tax=Alcaligenes xylosoxydans xylosoxydans TaxID=85698 RepID=UPI000B48E0CE|nr:hypothetical protein [Achromobacter xylosoxidans]
MNSLLRAAAPYLIWAGLVAAAVVGVRWYGASQFRAGVDKANVDHTLAELTEFKSQTARLGGISETLESALAALRDAKPKTIERYTRVEVQSPLPAGCRIDAERLQHINEAGRMANAAGQPGPAVPASTRGDQR